MKLTENTKGDKKKEDISINQMSTDKTSTPSSPISGADTTTTTSSSSLSCHFNTTKRSPLTTAQWVYLLVAQGVVAGIVNFFVNLFITWIIYSKESGALIDFSGQLTCILSDIIVTSFLLPVIMCLIGSILVTLDLRKGKLIKPIDRRWLDSAFVCWIPQGIYYRCILLRAVIFGMLGVLLFAPPTLIALFLATRPGGGDMLIKWTFYIFKGSWCALFAFVVAPCIAFILAASYEPNQSFLRRTSYSPSSPSSISLSPSSDNKV
ncbi:hypothetical protein SAMD00019534_068650 [Acytostelium subglobosum LB1]|uniref:hypothetical protein n=1 Tax=Acytostelium subglobosum LB1 TaxID=1410327 RepID=UPI000644F7B7|nr:hypothetical protein SAMD00019534_068650 [Acytostelium subglobosum LB1]GAM23690.1 hypothetical protein SAMD00019534_068650 [Acytostelium subglobosum LB1]|eukprot:XP_012753431.1 hypothetical protein SAMD00019534_068650 [Acytostelium subglobosum LB1]